MSLIVPGGISPAVGGIPFVFSTEVELLATSDPEGLLGFAFDTKNFFLRRGSNWVRLGGDAEVSAQASGPVTITADDVGKVFTNEGAAGPVTFDLPVAAAGLQYSFVVQAAQNLVVDAGSGDTIRVDVTASSAGGTQTSAVVGTTMTIVAINATEWVAIASLNAAGWTAA